MFRTIRIPAVLVLLGTSFIDRFTKGIILSKKKIGPFNSPPVRMIMVHEVESDSTEEPHDCTIS